MYKCIVLDVLRIYSILFFVAVCAKCRFVLLRFVTFILFRNYPFNQGHFLFHIPILCDRLVDVNLIVVSKSPFELTAV